MRSCERSSLHCDFENRGADTATIIYSYLGQAVGLGLLGSLGGSASAWPCKQSFRRRCPRCWRRMSSSKSSLHRCSLFSRGPYRERLGLGHPDDAVVQRGPAADYPGYQNPLPFSGVKLGTCCAPLVRREKALWKRAGRVMTADPRERHGGGYRDPGWWACSCGRRDR